MRHFPDLSCMVVDLPCFSVVRSLTSWYTFLLLFFLRHSLDFLALIMYPSIFCHLHLCPDLSFNLSIVFGSFWFASLFLQVSSSATKIKDLSGNPGIPLSALLAKMFGCCVSYCLVEVGDHGVQITFLSTSVARGANRLPIVA